MKSKLLYLSLTILSLLMFSCGEDRSGEYEALIAEDKWIKDQMSNIYLWYYDIPAESKLNFFQQPEEFFNSLLSTKCQEGKGDQYSYLETINNTTKAIDRESTYGFDFLLFQPSQTPKQVVARVLFVLKNSPAEKAGLRRGNWISKVNDEVLTKSNYGYLYNGETVKFTLAKADTADNTTLWTDTATTNLEASLKLENNPFYVDSIYHIDGKNIAYLMYNSFSTGPEDKADDNIYNDQMRAIFSKFKSGNINDFILDLRYNQGGYLSCSQVLASLLAPEDKLGQPYCSLAFNNLNIKQDTTYTLRENLTGGNNLNLNKLYVIVSDLTASASEAVINCLRPYMDVILVGNKTEGKNVASMPIYSAEYPNIILHPIVAIINNSKGESDYFRGMEPDYEYNESEEATFADALQPLGSTQEFLLKHTLELITNPPTESETTTQSTGRKRLQLKQIDNSMKQKKQAAIRLK